MKKNWRAQYMARVNGTLETYYKHFYQSYKKDAMREFKATAEANGWRLMQVNEL